MNACLLTLVGSLFGFACICSPEGNGIRFSRIRIDHVVSDGSSGTASISLEALTPEVFVGEPLSFRIVWTNESQKPIPAAYLKPPIGITLSGVDGQVRHRVPRRWSSGWHEHAPSFELRKVLEPGESITYQFFILEARTNSNKLLLEKAGDFEVRARIDDGTESGDDIIWSNPVNVRVNDPPEEWGDALRELRAVPDYWPMYMQSATAGFAESRAEELLKYVSETRATVRALSNFVNAYGETPYVRFARFHLASIDYTTSMLWKSEGYGRTSYRVVDRERFESARAAYEQLLELDDPVLTPQILGQLAIMKDLPGHEEEGMAQLRRLQKEFRTHEYYLGEWGWDIGVPGVHYEEDE